MSLWWLQSGWTDACCSRCGARITDTGGDPDWGLCYPCMTEKVNAERQAKADEEEYWRALAEEAERAEGER